MCKLLQEHGEKKHHPAVFDSFSFSALNGKPSRLFYSAVRPLLLGFLRVEEILVIKVITHTFVLQYREVRRKNFKLFCCEIPEVNTATMLC